MNAEDADTDNNAHPGQTAQHVRLITMAAPTTCPPFTPESVIAAHKRISSKIRTTPLRTSKSISSIASTPSDDEPAPKLNIYFKCENLQKVGCFKVRGAFNALGRVIDELGIDEVRKRGVVTHSSGQSGYRREKAPAHW